LQRKKAIDKLAENRKSRILITLRFSASFCFPKDHAAAFTGCGLEVKGWVERGACDSFHFCEPDLQGAGRCV